MTTLFNLTDAYQQVYDLIAEQGDETVLIETLQSINDALEEKADGYVAVIKTLEADNVAIDEEIKRLRQRKTSNQNGISRLKESLQFSMESTGKEKFKTALNSYSIANNPPSLDVTEESLIPKEYWVSQAPKLNKKDLLKDIKNGADIKGVEVKQTRSLRVR
ncbi:siphovirus Gp157 family protein [Staphylococcus pseudintermedius]|uniref:siphovirus Gp157 family protein n=1 Tax=Staphylococcus pseudintermedius TaxID=283734 RepID=UPI0019317969|nr:siphovirus Gp157 family protein [Staphylococcus pseudintermedius]EGQ4132990.1 siphovirus Gp157 family protein [Staphylococcus pseudintermedius]EHK9622154.1 siphovirus Gp157 family protein [Staphylococcus pseudintermedius]MBM0332648.1 siphovirus Gp157 family protein [Staphylococcus pseudintermedius]HBK0423049.1 siphovirus Gp157 family protein [Staphylococcus pseudintermedius]HDT8471941.1 siphovirus Gp157 family protein [Staphylococcus pseudintermedius]